MERMVLKIGQQHTDAALISGCIKQDRKIQKILFDNFAPKMLSVCKRYIKESTLAEEQMLQGFMTVFQKIESYKQEGSFEGWIRKIMVNTCLMWIRKNRVMYKEVDIDDVRYELNYEVLHKQLEVDDLLQLIHELPEGYRTVFNMYAIEGYSHAEVAEKLGISINTSKSQLSRARAYMQKRLSLLDGVHNKEKKSYEY